MAQATDSINALQKEIVAAQNELKAADAPQEAWKHLTAAQKFLEMASAKDADGNLTSSAGVIDNLVKFGRDELSKARALIPKSP